MSSSNVSNEMNDYGEGRVGEQTENTDPQSKMHPKAAKYIEELLGEKILLDHIKFPHAVKLIDQGTYVLSVLWFFIIKDFHYF